jgi:glycosyltransferase involved in cell wall biosynthesis
MISIIMPSYMGEYPYAAKNRVAKFHRAVSSVLNQSSDDWQLVIISDGCEVTFKEANQYKSDKVLVSYIEKQPTLSGEPRNEGIKIATGEYICYLDTDDYFGQNHIATLSNAIQDYDWMWFDDFIYNKQAGNFQKRICDINIRFRHGTSNICHRRSIPVRWTSGYEHDADVVNQLKRHSLNYAKAEAGEYCVCHIPNRYDV